MPDSLWDGKHCYVIIRSISGDRIAGTTVTAPGSFTVDLPKGRWELSGYLDLNGDGRFDTGALDPYRAPEPRAFAGDTLVVRERFILDGVVLQF